MFLSLSKTIHFSVSFAGKVGKSCNQHSQVLLVAISTVLFAAHSPASAQDSAESIGFQLWLEAPTQLGIRRSLTERMFLYFEPSPRIGGKGFSLNQLLLRSGMVYQPNNWFSARVTYDKLFNYDTGSLVHEHRIAEQAYYLGRLRRLWIANRIRVEQRFFDNVSGASLRLRNQISLLYPLRILPFGILFYDELFLNLNNTNNGPVKGFDRNRIFIGINKPLASCINLQVGYRLEQINRTDIDDEGRNQLLVNLTSVF